MHRFLFPSLLNDDADDSASICGMNPKSLEERFQLETKVLHFKIKTLMVAQAKRKFPSTFPLPDPVQLGPFQPGWTTDVRAVISPGCNSQTDKTVRCCARLRFVSRCYLRWDV